MVNSPNRKSNEFSPAELIENITRHVQEDELGKPMRLEHGDITDEYLIKKEHRVRPNRVYENIEDMPAFRPVGRAACAGIANPDTFFPEKTYGFESQKEKDAKAICAICFVRLDCLDYALKYKTTGIWGGLNEDERNKINKRPLK